MNLRQSIVRRDDNCASEVGVRSRGQQKSGSGLGMMPFQI